MADITTVHVDYRTLISAAMRAPAGDVPEPDEHAQQPDPTLPRATIGDATPLPPPLPAAKPVDCSTVATLPLGPAWTLRLNVQPACIELDLVCFHCGKGYSLDLDQRGNGALVRRILDTHASQHRDQHTEPTP